MIRIEIENVDSGIVWADYRYTVWVNRDCIERGVVKHHLRVRGWRPLLQRIAQGQVVARPESGHIPDRARA